MNKNTHLSDNISAHNKVADLYEDRHGEIFNEREQLRVQAAVNRVLSVVSTKKPITVLDYGCGTGNLSKHFVNQGCAVTAADVAPNFLRIIQKRFASNNPSVATVELNGVDLSQFEDNTFSVVATYSVLHHVPDYLAIIKEFVRVLKPGGILYIDHEVPESYWEKTPEYTEFIKKMKAAQSFPWKKLLQSRHYWSKLRKSINPKYQAEGDIHVFEDDHIEWSRIKKTITPSCTIIEESDYLVFRSGYDEKIYEAYKDQVTDMHLLIAKKV
jgi:ubiquinone/menaquinone biosynthesis C-methylase UbiE